jgi:hypothetical protein
MRHYPLVAGGVLERAFHQGMRPTIWGTYPEHVRALVVCSWGIWRYCMMNHACAGGESCSRPRNIQIRKKKMVAVMVTLYLTYHEQKNFKNNQGDNCQSPSIMRGSFRLSRRA